MKCHLPQTQLLTNEEETNTPTQKEWKNVTKQYFWDFGPGERVTFLPKTVDLHGLTYCSPFSTYCYTVAGHSQASSRCYTHSDTPTLPCHRQPLRYTSDHSYRYDFHMDLLLWETNLIYNKTQIWCRWI